MNEFQRRLMDKPDLTGDGLCVFCGRPSTERHHIVPRSQGGSKGPTVDVCGFGNASGCHGRLHAHELHLDWDDGWVYCETEPKKDVWRSTYEGDWRRL